MLRRIAGQTFAVLVIIEAALGFVLLAYVSWRDSNVSTIAVSRLSDMEEVFEVGASSLRIRNPEFLKICFTGDFVHALKDAQDWFRADETEFKRPLRAAGGRADPFNDDVHSAIVLLSHSSALILQLDWRHGLLLGNFGCANTNVGDIPIRRYQTNPSIEFYLPNATPKSPRGPGQPRATLCEENMERFVDTIDELLEKQVSGSEPFWAAIRKYLPATGCSASEVISAARRSKFLETPSSGANHWIFLRRENKGVIFRLHEETGEIDGTEIFAPGSWPFT
ncbi:MAG: hypothetical protein V4517_00830 [Pseudomonadota bacterium]